MTESRFELIRAVGAIADDPGVARRLCPTLGLGTPGVDEHTEVFVLNAPPYASVHLGPEGALGGEGADRVAGFWRALGLVAPPEPDHLASLLGLYADLGERGLGPARGGDASARWGVGAALLGEHLWSWAPGYLDAVTDLGIASLSSWAELARAVLLDERRRVRLEELPLALRLAPEPLRAGGSLDFLLDALTAPVRSGMVLSRHRLAVAASEIGVGLRIGERRYGLRGMLEQDPVMTFRWLSAEARRWAGLHARRLAGDRTGRWWHERALHAATVLDEAGRSVRRGVPVRA